MKLNFLPTGSCIALIIKGAFGINWGYIKQFLGAFLDYTTNSFSYYSIMGTLKEEHLKTQNIIPSRRG